MSLDAYMTGYPRYPPKAWPDVAYPESPQAPEERQCDTPTLPAHGAFSFILANNSTKKWLVCGPEGQAWTTVQVRRKTGAHCYRHLGAELRKLPSGKAVYEIAASFNTPPVGAAVVDE